jgi:hypothetical protein
MVAWDNTLAWLDLRRVIRIDRATGKRAGEVTLPAFNHPPAAGQGFPETPALVGVSGDVLVVDGGNFAAGRDRHAACGMPYEGRQSTGGNV